MLKQFSTFLFLTFLFFLSFFFGRAVRRLLVLLKLFMGRGRGLLQKADGCYGISFTNSAYWSGIFGWVFDGCSMWDVGCEMIPSFSLALLFGLAISTSLSIYGI